MGDVHNFVLKHGVCALRRNLHAVHIDDDTVGFTLTRIQVAYVGKVNTMPHETQPFWKARQGVPNVSSSLDHHNDSFCGNHHHSPPSSKPEGR
jgi:hypothetical protein